MFNAIMSLSINMSNKKHILAGKNGTPNGYSSGRDVSPSKGKSNRPDVTDRICRCNEYIVLIKSLRSEIVTLQSKIDLRDEQMERKECEIIQLHATMVSLEAELSSTKSEIMRLCDELETMKTSCEAYKKSIDDHLQTEAHDVVPNSRNQTFDTPNSTDSFTQHYSSFNQSATELCTNDVESIQSISSNVNNTHSFKSIQKDSIIPASSPFQNELKLSEICQSHESQTDGCASKPEINSSPETSPATIEVSLSESRSSDSETDHVDLSQDDSLESTAKSLTEDDIVPLNDKTDSSLAVTAATFAHEDSDTACIDVDLSSDNGRRQNNEDLSDDKTVVDEGKFSGDCTTSANESMDQTEAENMSFAAKAEHISQTKVKTESVDHNQDTFTPSATGSEELSSEGLDTVESSVVNPYTSVSNGFHSAEGSIRSLSPSEAEEVLKKSNLRVDAPTFCPRPSPHILISQLNAFLDTLTTEQDICYFNHLVDFSLIDNSDRMWDLVCTIYERAVHDVNRITIYIELFKSIVSHRMIDFGEINFNKLILQKCQVEFEADIYPNLNLTQRLEEIKQETNSARRHQLVDSLDAVRRPYMERKVGNAIIVGELYKKTMLSCQLIVNCMKSLITTCQHNPNLKSECLEILCILLKTTHRHLHQDIHKRLGSGLDQLHNQGKECESKLNEIKAFLHSTFDTHKSSRDARKKGDDAPQLPFVSKSVFHLLEDTLMLIEVLPYRRNNYGRNKRFNRKRVAQVNEWPEDDYVSSSGTGTPPLPFNSNSEQDFPPIGATAQK